MGVVDSIDLDKCMYPSLYVSVIYPFILVQSIFIALKMLSALLIHPTYLSPKP